MPTIATPLSVRSRPSAASPAATCWTYGQWLQMNVTTSAGPVSSSRLTVAPVAGSGSVNGGAGAPRASIADSVAMPARVGPQHLGGSLVIGPKPASPVKTHHGRSLELPAIVGTV